MELRLTSRQQRFVELFAISRCGTKAATGAGYTGRRAAAAVTASRLLKKANVQAALRTLETRIVADLEVTRQRVLNGLLEAVDEARQRREPVAMIAAWREVAKISGFYAPERSNVVSEVSESGARRRTETMTDVELVGLLADQTVDGALVPR